MPQIINDQSLSGMFGSSLGAGLGSGLSQGIQLLAQNKINQLSSRNLTQGLQSLGFSPEQSAGIAALPLPIQKTVLTEFLQSGAVPQNNQSIQQQLAGRQQPQAPIATQAQSPAPVQVPTAMQASMKALSQGQSVNPVANLLKSVAQQQQQVPQAAPMQTQLAAQQQPVPQPATPTPVNSKQQVPVARSSTKSVAPVTINQPEEQAAPSLIDSIRKGRMTQQERLHNQKELKEAAKETKEVYEKITKEDRSATESDRRLNRMQELIKGNGLPSSGTYRFMKAIESIPGVGPVADAIAGSVLRGVLFRDTDEFEKLSADFIKDAKSVFGARITDADLKAFMATVPTLSQTDNGKLRIIKNMKSFNEAAHIRAKAMRDIIKENGGNRPMDLEELVEERVQPKLDSISAKFIKG